MKIINFKSTENVNVTPSRTRKRIRKFSHKHSAKHTPFHSTISLIYGLMRSHLKEDFFPHQRLKDNDKSMNEYEALFFLERAHLCAKKKEREELCEYFSSLTSNARSMTWEWERGNMRPESVKSVYIIGDIYP